MDEPPLVPDSLFITKHEEEKKAVALELELNPKSKTRYKKIFSQYKDKENIWFVWYVVLNQSAGETLSGLWDKYVLWGDCQFAYSTLEKVFKDGFKLPKPREARKREEEKRETEEGTEPVRNSRIKTQIKAQGLYKFDYKVKCGQVLKNLKMTCPLPCSQSNQGKKGLNFNFPVSAHRGSFEFKGFYENWGLVRKWGKSSPILTTLPYQ